MKHLKLSITSSQKYLLQAIVGNVFDLPIYYDAWINQVNIVDYIDGESYRLLPLLYKRLVKGNIVDENINRYKGVYKKTLFKNSIHFNNLLSVGRELNKNHIPFTVIKGLAIILTYDQDKGLRHMNDIDLLVTKKQIPDTISVLQSHGFSPQFSYDVATNIDTRHSFAFSNSLGFEIDLHWKSNYLRNINITLTKTIALNYKGVAVNVLTPENQIINTLLHAATWDPVFIIRWVTDLYTILENEDAINWKEIINIIKNSSYSYTIYIMLSFFNEVSSIKIDEWVLLDCKKYGNNKKNMVCSKKNLTPPKTVFGKLGWHGYTMTNNDLSLYKKIIGFPKDVLMNSPYDSYCSLWKAFFRKHILGKHN
ncbi:MAG: nucleotidyltransferase family protein [Clostridiales bacterium]|nr:nucleotidyltransferase family protein [Clostridiales bacterium]